MTRIWCAALLLTVIGGCDKGNEEKCKTAVRNVYELTGANRSNTAVDEPAAIRSCRANAATSTIDCVIGAKDVIALRACGSLGSGSETVPAKPEAEAAKPEAEAAKPEAEAAKPEAEAAKPEAAKPEAEATKPEAAKPEAEAAKPEAEAAKPE